MGNRCLWRIWRNTAIAQAGFTPPVPLEQALEQTTIRYEFMEDHGEEGVFYSE